MSLIEERLFDYDAQKDTGKSAGTPAEGNGPRSRAKEEASQFGVETKGRSIHAIRKDVEKARKAQESMAAFINKVVDERVKGPEQGNGPAPVQIENQHSESPAHPIKSVAPTQRKGGGGDAGTPVTLYINDSGVYSTLEVLTSGGPTPV